MSLVLKQVKLGRIAAGNPYMMGDPGLFSGIGKLIKKVAAPALNIATSLIPGGTLIRTGVKTILGAATAGAGAAAIGGAAGAMASRPALPGPPQIPITPFAPPRQLPPPPGVQVVPSPGVRGAIQRFVPGGATGYQASGPPPRGYRLNKSNYFLRDGTFVPAGTRYVKIRRRNALNPRALDRAMGRLTSAKKAAKKINRISIRAKKC